jgi:hypothetical protein
MSDAVEVKPACDHGVVFDVKACEALLTEFRVGGRGPDVATFEIRKRWPRLFGACPKGCGFDGIAYASQAHYVYGDW